MKLNKKRRPDIRKLSYHYEWFKAGEIKFKKMGQSTNIDSKGTKKLPLKV